MERINRKKLILIIFLLVAIVTELIAIGLSKANKTIQIEMTINDYSKVIDSVKYQISAIDNGAGYYITLPETINSNIVSKYYVTTSSTSTPNNTTNSANTQTNQSANNSNQVLSNSVSTTTTQETVAKNPGDTVYLTSDQVSSKTITIQAEYDKKTSGAMTLYNKKITKQINTVAFSISGYMPKGATLSFTDISSKNTDIEKTAQTTYDASLSLLDTYCFKILTNTTDTYNPNTYAEKLTASFENLSTSMSSEIAKVIEKNNEYIIRNEIR